MNTTEKMYAELGISQEVYEYGKTILDGLQERFARIDEVAEYNQLKVLKAMQENQVSEACLLGTTGYGIMIWEEILWRRFMRKCFIQRMRWYALRLPAEPMPLH